MPYISSAPSRAARGSFLIRILMWLQFSSHSAVMAAYGKEFAKTEILDPKFHRYIIIAERRRETGHYGVESGITEEEARESFEGAEEFMQAAKEYLER